MKPLSSALSFAKRKTKNLRRSSWRINDGTEEEGTVFHCRMIILIVTFRTLELANNKDRSDTVFD